MITNRTSPWKANDIRSTNRYVVVRQFWTPTYNLQTTQVIISSDIPLFSYGSIYRLLRKQQYREFLSIFLVHDQNGWAQIKIPVFLPSISYDYSTRFKLRKQWESLLSTCSINLIIEISKLIIDDNRQHVIHLHIICD
jgi:hypothetical protein